MTLDQLRIFVAVAERQHMTKAAQELHLTQSTVSGAIRTLEMRYAISLFNRIGRRIELSRDGLAFLAEAQAVLRTAKAAERAMKELRGLERGVVSIFASQTVGTYWLPHRLKQFHVVHPNIEFDVRLGNTDQVAEAVNRGVSEIGLAEGEISQKSLIVATVGFDKLKVVADIHQPWKRGSIMKSDHILGMKWVLREQGSGTRSIFENALRKAGVDPRALPVILTLPSNEAVRAAVENGIGATAISEAVIRDSISHRKLREIPFAPMERPYLLLLNPERKISWASSAFCDLLRK